MKYCSNCFYPETKPDLVFDNKGLCSACVAFEKRKKIDWKKREKDFVNLIGKFKKKNNYDCVVPVSGGKDSTYQVLKILEYGLNPLCVNATTCDLSDLGRKNLENIKSFGVDVVEFAPNKKVRKKLNALGLREIGDISWPEHVGIFTIPVRMAVLHEVQLIVWGENSQNEYGGPLDRIDSINLDRKWLEEFGGLIGLRVTDLIDHHGFKEKELLPYIYPSYDELEKNKIKGIFLGQFFQWDGNSNAKIANKNGFTYYEKLVEGAANNYENLDNYQAGIHDYFKYIKYGFGRATDIMSNLVRRKLITRKEGIDKIKKFDGNFPNTYLGKPLKEIIENIEIDIEEFMKICDKFTNKDLFKLNNKNEPIRGENNNLIKKFDGDLK